MKVKVIKNFKIQIITGLVALLTLVSFILPSGVGVAQASMYDFPLEKETSQTVDTYLEQNPISVPGMNDEDANAIAKNMISFAEKSVGVSSTEKSVITNKFIESMNSEFSLHVSTNLLNFDKVTVLQVSGETREEDYYTITVPVTDDKYNFFSSVTAIYDMNQKLKGYQETLVFESASKTFEVESYADGSLMNHEILDEAFVANEDLQQQLQDVQNEIKNLPQARGLAEKAACLVIVLGISRTIANIIAPVCAGACLAVPVVCAACITGFVALGGSAIAGVIGCFKL
ncbi:hypothetical protein A5844_000946 [Enterococcus sp. 10A9_DIV0425]|uniref:Uncharacterized protein n=1 Tax=Candidatus Enterococcus wittei TaxID=1987383 RepID=A0A242K023_9ENTE|nr:hypothetical protein A5844_000946 [Enterococcus sp. 10A9_DIV0425]